MEYNELKKLAKKMGISYVGIKRTALEQILKEACEKSGKDFEKAVHEANGTKPEKKTAESIAEKKVEEAREADPHRKEVAKKKKEEAKKQKKAKAEEPPAEEPPAQEEETEELSDLQKIADGMNKVLGFEEPIDLELDDEELLSEINSAFEETEPRDFGINAKKGQKVFSDEVIILMIHQGLEVPAEAVERVNTSDEPEEEPETGEAETDETETAPPAEKPKKEKKSAPKNGFGKSRYDKDPIREYWLKHPNEIYRTVAEHFHCSPQTVFRVKKKMEKEGAFDKPKAETKTKKSK